MNMPVSYSVGEVGVIALIIVYLRIGDSIQYQVSLASKKNVHIQISWPFGVQEALQGTKS